MVLGGIRSFSLFNILQIRWCWSLISVPKDWILPEIAIVCKNQINSWATRRFWTCLIFNQNFHIKDWFQDWFQDQWTLFPPRYLGPLLRFRRGRVKITHPRKFSREVLVQFTSNLVSILPTISTSKINQNGTPGHVNF